MSKKYNAFRSADALKYAETYRRLVGLEPARLEAEKKELENRFWSMESVPSTVYAEMRAYEHALAWLLERKEPEVVVLDDRKEEEEPDDPTLAEQLLERQQLVQRLEGELMKQQRTMQELQAEVVQRRQEVGALRRQLSQAYSSMWVVGVSFVIGVAVYLAILWYRP